MVKIQLTAVPSMLHTPNPSPPGNGGSVGGADPNLPEWRWGRAAPCRIDLLCKRHEAACETDGGS